ncbi:unnamed protein product [Parnassius mnemosyne]|uniref:J domain-containing protein n=1 Tax=Parnassius mnemosyne TaxID=213953 RepID=A0AAV1L4M0_9NEOP
MIRLRKSTFLSGVIRNISSSPSFCASHYDVLGITPKATQSDIKSAYYELSKVYHPDKSNDETAEKKFRAITEAYKVLGNVKLKKMYDKGLLVGRENTTRMDYQPEPEPTDPTLRFYKSHSKRQVTPTIDGKTPIYDFDAWSKQHYGDLLQKSIYEKEFIRKQNTHSKEASHAYRQEAMLYVVFAICFLFAFVVFYGKEDYDRDHVLKQNSSQKTKSS